MFIRRLLPLIFTVASFPTLLQAAEVNIGAGQSILFNQVDFPDDESPLLDSAIGRLEANLYVLRENTGMSTGFINLVIDGDWRVRNMLVPSQIDYPYPQMTSNFDLGVNEGTDVSTLNATVVFSDELLTSAPSPSPASFSVGSFDVSQGGFGESTTQQGSATAPPAMTGISFGDVTNNRQAWQLDHPNIEAAVNQCYPMAIANSLQFLENTTKLNLPHSHVKGLRGDNSLVGQLGLAMNRTVSSRTSGSGVNGLPGIQGKLQYLASNSLHERVQTRHWGLANNQNVSVTVNNKTATSTAQGTTINFDKMVEALEGGENCEAGYIHSRGGHFVDIVAAGYIAGQPFIIEASDIAQRDDSKGAGKSGFLFSHLKDTDNDGGLNMNGSTTELIAMICQKYIPPPVPETSLLPPPTMAYLIPGAQLEVVDVDDPDGHSCCVKPPPSLVSLLFKDGKITIEDQLSATPWLPFIVIIDLVAATFEGTETSTVAGFQNVESTMSGSVSEQKLTAQISLGSSGGLPGGKPITYTVEITPEDGWPWLAGDMETALRINGVRGSHTVAAGEAISIGVSINQGASSGEGEWFIVAQSGDQTFSLNLDTGSWLPGLNPAKSGAIENVANEGVFTLTAGLPPGEYTFYFGVDTNVNGSVDTDSLTYDSLMLTVQ